MQINKEKIISIFKNFWVEGILNIKKSTKKKLEYSPLHDEISMDSMDLLSASVILIKDHRKVVYNMDWFTEQRFEEAIEEASKLLKYSEYDTDITLPYVDWIEEKDFSNEELKNLDFDFLKSEFLRFKNYNFDERIKIESFSNNLNIVEHHFFNSLWSHKIQKDAYYKLSYEVYWQYKETKDTAYKYIISSDKILLDDKDIKKLEEQAIDKVSNSDNTISSGKYNITLDKEVVSDFLDILLWWLNAERVRENISLFSKYSIWDQILSKEISIENNPNLDWWIGNLLFDEEWIKQRKTILFENWILKNKFYDYKNARKDSLEYLWNSTQSNIIVKWYYSNDYLKDSRILFANLMAFHTVDENSGKFALNWEWYLIENGEKKWYIKNISLSGNIIDLFNSILALWDDLDYYSTIITPSITFRDQKVIWNI